MPLDITPYASLINTEISLFSQASESVNSDVSWTDLSSPPAPTAINAFPAPSDNVVVAARTQVTGDGSAYSRDAQGTVLYDCSWTCLGWTTAFARWNKVVQCTATPDTPFSHNISVTKGSSTSTHFNLGYSISATGGIPGFGEISSTISTEFGMEFSFSQEVTVAQEFQVTPTRGPVSVVWWQTNLLFMVQWKYLVNGHKHYNGHVCPYAQFDAGPHYMSDSVDTFVSTQFPPYQSGDKLIMSFGGKPIESRCAISNWGAREAKLSFVSRGQRRTTR